MSGANGTEAPQPEGAGLTEGAKDAKAERLLDLDVFRPETARPESYTVRVLGVTYPVRQIMQLTGQEELDLTALDKALEAATTEHDVRRAMFDRAFHLVRILVPGMSTHIRLGLRYEEALEISRQAWAYATADPTLGATDSPPAPGASLSAASPVSLASTQAA